MPESDQHFLELAGIAPEAVKGVAAALLYAVYRDAVDYLITEDRELRNLARRLGVHKRVLSIYQALELVSRWAANKDIPRPPALEDLPVHNLRLSDPIFAQLRKEYTEFDSWFQRVTTEGRRCCVYFNTDKTIGALLIRKLESESIELASPLPEKKRLKISTLVVTHRGYKIGELFLKLAIHYAIRNDCEEVYLSHFVSADDPLVSLLASYGFQQIATNRRSEGIFLKELYPNRVLMRSVSPSEVSQKFYPNFCDSRKVNKFIVPIRPEYHQRLFVDYPNRQTTLGEYSGEFIVEGNTIKKAYVSNSRNRTLSRGDVLLFYRSVDTHQITTLGVVESVYRVRDLETVLELVQKRTVYSIDELQEMFRLPTIVILFTWHFHLQQPVGITRLHTIGIFAPQSLVKITESQFEEIKRMSGIDRRFTLD